MNPSDCDHYLTCNACICPIDKLWHKRKHIQGERVCFYLIESQKADAEAIFTIVGKEELYKRIQGVIEEIINSSCTIRHTLKRAQLSGPRMNRKFPSYSNAERKNGK